jgi:hypothetical protein
MQSGAGPFVSSWQPSGMDFMAYVGSWVMWEPFIQGLAMRNTTLTPLRSSGVSAEGGRE